MEIELFGDYLSPYSVKACKIVPNSETRGDWVSGYVLTKPYLVDKVIKIMDDCGVTHSVLSHTLCRATGMSYKTLDGRTQYLYEKDILFVYDANRHFAEVVYVHWSIQDLQWVVRPFYSAPSIPLKNIVEHGYRCFLLGNTIDGISPEDVHGVWDDDAEVLESCGLDNFNDKMENKSLRTNRNSISGFLFMLANYASLIYKALITRGENKRVAVDSVIFCLSLFNYDIDTMLSEQEKELFKLLEIFKDHVLFTDETLM